MSSFWRLSLRARLMIIGLTGVAVALILGGLAFYAALTASINRTLDNGALASAEATRATPTAVRVERTAAGHRPGLDRKTFTIPR